MFEEKDLYEQDEDRPTPRGGHPLLLLLYAFLIGAGWVAWQMHRRAVARAAPGAVPAGSAAMQGQTPLPAPVPLAPGADQLPAPDPEARPAPIPPAAGANMRRFYGVVYDLSTKKPLAGAKVFFDVGQPGGVAEQAPCLTDLNGHYTCDLSDDAAPVSVYVLTEGYKGQFEDLVPPLHARSVSERRAVLAQRDDYLEPARVLFSTSQEIVPLDLVVVPKAWLPPTPPVR